jgi:hypothetical protein
MSGAEWLEFICYVGAGLGLVAYVLNFLRRARFIRLFNSAGLVLTAGALIVLPTALQIDAVGARVTEGFIAAVLLMLGMLSQGWAALRRRKPRTGLRERAADRRGPDARTRASDGLQAAA